MSSPERPSIPDITQAFPKEDLARSSKENLKAELPIHEIKMRNWTADAAPTTKHNLRIEDIATRLLRARLEAGEEKVDIAADARRVYLNALKERAVSKASAEFQLTREAMVARRILQDLGYNLSDLDAEMVDIAAERDTSIPSS